MKDLGEVKEALAAGLGWLHAKSGNFRGLG